MTEAEEEFKKKILKAAPETTSLVGRLLGRRKVSFIVVKYLHKTGVAPNQITYLEILLLVFSGFMIATGVHSLMIIGAAAFLTCSYLDHVDGDLARAKSMCSKRGKMLDTFAFYLSQGVLILGPLAAIYRDVRSSWILICGGFMAVCAAVCLTLTAVTESVQSVPSQVSAPNEPERAIKLIGIRKELRRKVRQIFRIDVDGTDLFGSDARLLVLVLGCLAGRLSWVLVYFLISFTYLLVFDLYPKYIRFKSR